MEGGFDDPQDLDLAGVSPFSSGSSCDSGSSGTVISAAFWWPWPNFTLELEIIQTSVRIFLTYVSGVEFNSNTRSNPSRTW